MASEYVVLRQYPDPDDGWKEIGPRLGRHPEGRDQGRHGRQARRRAHRDVRRMPGAFLAARHTQGTERREGRVVVTDPYADLQECLLEILLQDGRDWSPIKTQEYVDAARRIYELVGPPMWNLPRVR